jgi:hypothetical protein
MRKERLTINAPQSLLAIGRDMKSRGLLHSAPVPEKKYEEIIIGGKRYMKEIKSNENS